MNAAIQKTESAIRLSDRQRFVILAAAFLSWTGAGMQMSAIPARPAILHFLTQRFDAASQPAAMLQNLEKEVGMWTAWYHASFLLGAALGGLVFGWAGDRIGRVKALTLSVLCYAIFTVFCASVTQLEGLIGLRFLAGAGVGGVWPTGVALAMETWSGNSRGLVSGVIGAAANVGLSLMGLICARHSFKLAEWALVVGRNVSADDWRWVMIVAASPGLLGILIPFIVSESPDWQSRRSVRDSKSPVRVVFRPPYLRRTLIGIVLGTIPLLGGWASINWAVNWSDAAVQGGGDQSLKAHTQFMRSFGAILGSFCGGWLAMVCGRRTTYFLICLGSLLTSGYLFWFLTPTSPLFLPWMLLTGLIATTAFGWLPLYLPELFPTEVRATGSGVTFNFGRILTVGGVLGTGYLLSVFDGDYARTGRVTHLIFALGMVAIFFAPDTSKQLPPKNGSADDSVSQED